MFVYIVYFSLDFFVFLNLILKIIFKNFYRIIVRFEDKRGRQCESFILKLLNSTKCLERNITENNSKSENFFLNCFTIGIFLFWILASKRQEDPLSSKI